MKTHKKGNGLCRQQIVDFCARLAYQGLDTNSDNEYIRGWANACQYFAHVLRKELRETEREQENLTQHKTTRK